MPSKILEEMCRDGAGGVGSARAWLLLSALLLARDLGARTCLLGFGGGRDLERQLGIGARKLALDREGPLAVLVGFGRSDRLAVADDLDLRARLGAAREHRRAVGIDARHVERRHAALDAFVIALGLRARCRRVLAGVLSGERLLDGRAIAERGKLEVAEERPHCPGERQAAKSGLAQLGVSWMSSRALAPSLAGIVQQKAARFKGTRKSASTSPPPALMPIDRDRGRFRRGTGTP